MSMITDAFAAARRLVLMDAEIERMRTAIDRCGERLDDHQARLIRIETLIEFSRPRLPRS